jgi:hypothetical protein
MIFYNHFYNKARFAEAIAVSDRWQNLPSQHLLWSQYRLGMYRTVSDARVHHDHWRVSFARAVSYAACADHDKATEIASFSAKKYGNRKDFFTLTNALASFMPEYALELIENRYAPLSLRVALLQRNMRFEESNQLLQCAFGEGQQHDNPELYLYQGNLWPWSNRKKLDYLNSYLHAFALTSVALQEEHGDFCPYNLQSVTDCISDVQDGPLVSVLMTAYQSGAHVGVAMASILGQSWRNIELIVVDDASTDATVEAIERWCKVDPRVRFVRLHDNIGTYAAKNIGLQYASGEFVTCHDSDDWAHPMKIERQVMPLLQHRKLVCTTSDWVRMQDDGTFYARQVHPLQRFNPSSPLFRRKDVLERIGAWDWVRTGADSEFAARLKLVFGSRAVLRIRQPLTIGSHRQGSLMTDAVTGYTSGSVPPDRLEYWESWTYWHIKELRAGRKPRMPDMLSDRVFKAPENIAVPVMDIAENLKGVRKRTIQP